MIRLSQTAPVIIVFFLLFVTACNGDADHELTPGEQEAIETLAQPETMTVRSDDGTRIGYTKIGSGPIPVVFVHGALNTGEQWMEVAEKLSDQYTCYVIDRWGRGGSEHRADYSLELEIADIVAVLEEAGPDSYVLGHSSGAIYALEAAKRAPVAGLILYEPPLHAFIDGPSVDETFDRIYSAFEDERYEESLYIFLSEEARVPDEAIVEMETTPFWEHMLEHTPHSVIEWKALMQEDLDLERYRDISVPTLMLAGTVTEEHPSFATQALDDLLPDTRIAMLEGEGHTANLSSPGMVSEKIDEFISATVR